jgi:predicted ATPase
LDHDAQGHQIPGKELGYYTLCPVLNGESRPGGTVTPWRDFRVFNLRCILKRKYRKSFT